MTEFSWPKPARPGDVLRVESEVIEIKPSRSRPDRGMVTVRSETRNQREEIVQILVAMLIVPRRPTVADATVMVRNLGLVDKNAQKAAKELIMSQANGRALVRSQHFLPYAEIQIKSFEDRVASPVVTS